MNVFSYLEWFEIRNIAVTKNLAGSWDIFPRFIFFELRNALKYCQVKILCYNLAFMFCWAYILSPFDCSDSTRSELSEIKRNIKPTAHNSTCLIYVERNSPAASAIQMRSISGFMRLPSFSFCSFRCHSHRFWSWNLYSIVFVFSYQSIQMIYDNKYLLTERIQRWQRNVNDTATAEVLPARVPTVLTAEKIIPGKIRIFLIFENK